MTTIWLWIGFSALILFLVALDLGVFHRKSHVISTGEALAWTGFWIALALAFNIAVYYMYEEHLLGVGVRVGLDLTGEQAALEYFTGYLLEKSLSVDNIFVIAMIFAYFRVPLRYQHRLLFWGVLGALVLRGVLIVTGARLIQRFDWFVYIFGAILIVTAVKMLVVRHDNLEPEKNPLIWIARRFYPVTSRYDEGRFFTLVNGRRAATPMFLALIVIESTDLLFAVDSIPAIFAVTTDPFLIFTSNAFAILGLRSLYFALAALMDRFRYLKASLVFILAFIGAKMLLSHHHPIPIGVSLPIIGSILVVGIVASAISSDRDTGYLQSPLAGQLVRISRLTPGAARTVLALVIVSTVLVFGLALALFPGLPPALGAFAVPLVAAELWWGRRLLRRIRRSAERERSEETAIAPHRDLSDGPGERTSSSQL